MTMRKKLLITIACLSVILCTLITGTIAWLIDDTESIVNKFTPSNIKVELTEVNKGDNYKFQMIPGKTYAKDPKVTVTNDIDCYVFVKVVETNNTWGELKAVVYTVDSGWTELQDGVYYRVVDATADVADKTFSVIAGDKVEINSKLDKAYMASLDADSKYPTLTFTAYACQKDGFNDAAAAWAEASTQAKP